MNGNQDRWTGSDLIGIPVTLIAFGVLALAGVVAYFTGPVGGFVFATPVSILLFYVVARGFGESGVGDTIYVKQDARGHRERRVLLIANQGLERSDVCEEVCRSAGSERTEALIVAPVHASSRLGTLSDDVDRQRRDAQRRVDAVLGGLRTRGVRASGHVDDEADATAALADGLREFPANEVIVLRDTGPEWDRAHEVLEQIRKQGLPVTEAPALGPASPAVGPPL